MLLKSMSPVSFYFLHVAAKRFYIPYVAGIPFLSDDNSLEHLRGQRGANT